MQENYHGPLYNWFPIALTKSLYLSDLESSAKLLEDLTSSKGKDRDGVDPVQRSLMNLRGQLQASEAKVKALEEACAEAEEVKWPL